MLDAVQWWFAVLVVSFLALPLCLAIFHCLPDHGYAFNKAFALVLVAYVFWMMNSLHVAPNTRTGALTALMLVACTSAAAVWSRRRVLVAWLRVSWAYIVLVEALTLIAFALSAWFQAYASQILFDETPMEFMLLNAVHQADNFPPRDAWLSGHDVSYYYVGYVMVSMLARIASVTTEIAFNLGFATFAAAGVAAAFGIAFNLLQLRRAGNAPAGRWRASMRQAMPSLTGALGATALIFLMGNLVAALLFASAYGLGTEGFFDALGIRGLTAGEARRWWYPSEPFTFDAVAVVIHVRNDFGFVESPFQSILTADLHPHFIDLPFVFLALGCALALLVRPTPSSEGAPSAWAAPQFLRASAIGLLLGATGVIHTWDLPFVLAVAVGVIALRAWWERSWLPALFETAVIAATALIAYLPFYLQLDRASGGLYIVVENDFVTDPGSRIDLFLLHWLPLMLLAATFTAIKLSDGWRRIDSRVTIAACAAPLLVVACWLIVFAAQYSAGDANLHGAGGLLDQLTARAMGWLSALVAAALFISAFTALSIQPHASSRDRADAFTLALTASAAGIILLAEFFYVDDFLQSRLVSLFKLAYVAWTFLAVASGYAAYDLLMKLRDGSTVVRATAAAAALAVIAGVLLPIGGVPNRIHPDRPPEAVAFPRTLDALALYDADERAAIGWLRDRARGQELVIAESVVDQTGRSDYTSAGRLSMASGVPAVLAWPGHQQQWRGSADPLGTRQEDIDTLYRSGDIDAARRVISRYGVDLVAVGLVERAVYPAQSLAKFEEYPVAFTQGDVTIYNVAE